jgi:hypothetical protein
VQVLVAAHHQQLEAQPALLQNTNFLKEKITLMCLTETLFQRIGPAADRSVSFNDIAAASKLPCNQVEAEPPVAPASARLCPRTAPATAAVPVLEPHPHSPQPQWPNPPLARARPGRAAADARALAAAHPRQDR